VVKRGAPEVSAMFSSTLVAAALVQQLGRLRDAHNRAAY